MANELILKRYNKDVYQFLVKGRVVAFTIKDANGLWGVSDCNDRKIIGARFEKPKEAFQYYLDKNWIDGVND